MISDKMVQHLNAQLNAEFYSGYLYLQMAAYFDEKNLAGFAHWMKIQAKEEFSHGMKIYSYINDRGGKVLLEAVEKPRSDYASVQEIFEQTLSHEQKVTKSIDDLVELAIEERDHATRQYLDWFVKEQVEEEATAAEVLGKVKMAKDAPSLLMLDHALSQRES